MTVSTVQIALSAVMEDVRAVGKDGTNTSQNYSFRGIDGVVNAVGPALRKHRVLVLPRVLSSQYRDITTSNGKVMHSAILEVEFTFVGPDGDKLVCSAMGESADSGDKATPKAHSVAFRTALLQALCIPTDEPDPDASSFERGRLTPAQEMGWADDQAQADEFERLKSTTAAMSDPDDVKAWVKAQGLTKRSMTPELAGEWSQQVADAIAAKEPAGA